MTNTNDMREAFQDFRDQRNKELAASGDDDQSKFWITNAHYTAWCRGIAWQSQQAQVPEATGGATYHAIMEGDYIQRDTRNDQLEIYDTVEAAHKACPAICEVVSIQVRRGKRLADTASPAPDHSGDGNEMVEVPFHKLALGTRFRYTSILESEYVKISATQVARWQDDMAIAGWSGQGVYSFDESDDTNITVLVAATATTCQQEEAER